MINLIAFLLLKHFLISLKMPSVFSSPDADVLGGVGGFSLKNMITSSRTNEAMIACHKSDYATCLRASSL